MNQGFLFYLLRITKPCRGRWNEGKRFLPPNAETENAHGRKKERNMFLSPENSQLEIRVQNSFGLHPFSKNLFYLQFDINSQSDLSLLY